MNDSMNDSMSELQVNAAFDGSLIRTIPRVDHETAFATLARSYALFLDRDGWIPKHERMAILERAADIIASRHEELSQQAAREGGKPLVDSRVEISRAVAGIRSAVAELHHWHGEQVPMGLTASSVGRVAYTWWEPRGVVLAISAFNHPFNLIIHQVVTAVAAGCPVLVKPASTTPLSCQSLVSILHEAGLPPAWCQMVMCDNATATALVGDTRVSFLTFIGSARVGWYLRSKLAAGAACALEHGGIAPVILDETADLDRAIPLLVKGGFYHAGQVCVSVQRIYVHASIQGAFLHEFVAQVKALRVGDPLDPETEVGPLILPREADRVADWVDKAVEAGAELLCGGERLSETTYAPTVLLEPPDDALVSCQEVFGPVVAVYGYTDLADAVARANGPDVCFQASVFTQDVDRAWDLSRRLNGVTMMVNDHTAFRVDWMPFGGARGSGLGIGGIGHAMRDMSLERMVVFRSPAL
jgi:acyl-CoA reductase-like NAD-dependent aldehyde dehydrogenase